MSVVGVSIINYQAAVETIRCVESLLAESASAGIRLQVQVADNHSDEEDWVRLRRGLDGVDGVTLQRHERNLGFAAGHNRNLARLLNGTRPDFIWLLNNDCIVQPGALAALLRCAGRCPDTGLWGATLLESAEGPVQCAGGCRYRPWLSSYHPLGRGTALSGLHELPQPALDYVAGASLFMPASTLTDGLLPPPSRGDLGHRSPQWLNETFFLYFEELDLARRLKPGLGQAWCREALIVHAGGAGTGSRSNARSRKGEFHSTLSALQFTDLHLPGMLWLTAPARLLAKTFISLATLRFDLLGALFSAYGAFFAWRRGGPRH